MYADQTITNHQPTSFLSPLKCTYQIKIDWLLDLLIVSKSSLTGFAFLCYRIGLKNLQHQNWKQNQLKLETCSYRFPMLCVIIISPQCTMGCTRSHTMCQRYAITLSFVGSLHCLNVSETNTNAQATCCTLVTGHILFWLFTVIFPFSF